ncbi:hypothetical protein HK100_010786, partial [Physocladia obscura]
MTCSRQSSVLDEHFSLPLPASAFRSKNNANVSPNNSNTLAQPSKSLKSFESWFGFVKERADAVLLVEAVIAGTVKALKMVPADATLRSGSVIVFAESSLQTQMTRWRDGESWSPSRIHGPFLLYREVESTKGKVAVAAQNEKCRFGTTSFRPNSRPVQNGFAKRTITLIGSDNNKYRVISYFFPQDVAHMYGDASTATTASGSDRRKLEAGDVLETPSESPEFRMFSGNRSPASTSPSTPRLSPAVSDYVSQIKKRSIEVVNESDPTTLP